MKKKINDEIIQFINEGTFVDKLWVEANHPADIAEVLSKFKLENILQFINLLSNQEIAQIIEHMGQGLQKEIIKSKEIDDIIDIFSYMSTDNITDILGNLSVNIRKKLLNQMKQGEAQILRSLLGYEIDSAGGIMTTEYILLKDSLTKKEALEKIKEIGPKTEVIEIIYINNKDKELVGTINLRDILSVPNDTILRELMDENLITVTPEIDQEEVAYLVAKYDLTAIPVINKKGVLLGIITVDDIIDVIESENTEDMLRMVGVHEEESINSPLGKSIIRRLPWLITDLGTTFLSSFIVTLFEDVIAQVIVLSAILPILANMGGNAGGQTLSVVIRGIALGEININSKRGKMLIKEGLLGLINGAVLGLVASVVLYIIHGNIYIGLIVFLAMVINLFIAGLLGFLIPYSLKLLGFDPALGSAIFLTTFTDIFGFLIFLSLAKIFINYLV